MINKLKTWYQNSDNWDWEFIHCYSFFLLMLSCIPMGCYLITQQDIQWVWITLIALLLSIEEGFKLFFCHYDTLISIDKRINTKVKELFPKVVHKIGVWFLGE